MEVSEVQAGRLYLATYQVADGILWMRGGKYVFATDTNGPTKNFEVSPDGPGLAADRHIPET